jgi:hypothetical protein
VIHGLEHARKVTELEADLWINTGRGGFEGTSDPSLTSVHINFFPLDEPRDLKHSYTITVASPDQHRLFLYHHNHLMNNLEPNLLESWQRNILDI